MVASAGTYKCTSSFHRRNDEELACSEMKES